jgi:DNA (cytosine-5)-methyltransferase 1
MGRTPWPARPGAPQLSFEAPRLAAGVPERVAKLRALGNAVCPQQALALFEAIAEQDREEEEEHGRSGD